MHFNVQLGHNVILRPLREAFQVHSTAVTPVTPGIPVTHTRHTSHTTSRDSTEDREMELRSESHNKCLITDRDCTGHTPSVHQSPGIFGTQIFHQQNSLVDSLTAFMARVPRLHSSVYGAASPCGTSALRPAGTPQHLAKTCQQTGNPLSATCSRSLFQSLFGPTENQKNQLQ